MFPKQCTPAGQRQTRCLWGFLFLWDSHKAMHFRSAVLPVLTEAKASPSPGLYFSAVIKCPDAVGTALSCKCILSMIAPAIRRGEGFFLCPGAMHLGDKTYLVINLYVPGCLITTSTSSLVCSQHSRALSLITNELCICLRKSPLSFSNHFKCAREKLL